MDQKDLLAIGEFMLELAPAGRQADSYTKRYAGDTFNTAMYASYLGLSCGYFTGVGEDEYSREALAIMRANAINTEQCKQYKKHNIGLYMIKTDGKGERSFCYWRENSAARQMLSSVSDLERLTHCLRAYKAVYFSGISLAILDNQARQNLLSVLKNYRKEGGLVIFDNNYRPRLWSNQELARTAMMAALLVSDLALLTHDDEQELWGPQTIEDTLERCQNVGVNKVVLKRGAQSVCFHEHLQTGSSLNHFTQVPVEPIQNVVDTTAAGDSFNAAFIAAYMKGEAISYCVKQGILSAGTVIQYPGAIMEKATYLGRMRPDNELAF